MFPAPTATWRLDDVLAKLRTQRAVAGLALIGSTGGAAFHAQSDYDLLLVVDRLPDGGHVLLTSIDGRLCDVVFLAAEALEQLEARRRPVPAGEPEATLLLWIANATILHDRQGRLARLQATLAAEDWLGPPTAQRQAEAVAGLNYNLRQNRRMLAVADPVYQRALALRLLYAVADACSAYFTLRDQPWRGEKAAIRHWQSHDPKFLEKLDAFHDAAGVAARFAAYEAVVVAVLGPQQPLWEAASTQISLANFRGDHEAQAAAVYHFWAALLA